MLSCVCRTRYLLIDLSRKWARFRGTVLVSIFSAFVPLHKGVTIGGFSATAEKIWRFSNSECRFLKGQNNNHIKTITITITITVKIAITIVIPSGVVLCYTLVQDRFKKNKKRPLLSTNCVGVDPPPLFEKSECCHVCVERDTY